jgi:hypothetical protein
MFSDVNSLTPTANNTSINTVRISNGIFDHLNLLNILYVISNVFDTTIPTEWTEETLLDCTFKGTIDGGSIGQFIGYVDHLEVQRQEVGTNEWITLQKIYKNTTTGILNASFTMNDTYAQNNTIYEYRIVPVDTNGVFGIAISQQVLSLFENAYIADASNIYKITNEYAVSNAQTNQKSALYEPYGSQFPFVAYNAVTKYDSASVTAILLSSTSESRISSYIDRMAQVNLVKEFNTWLTNGRAKILKDFNGKIHLITVHNPIPNNYYKELGNGIASTSFDYVEIGNITQTYLDKLGMTNRFPIEYKD